MANKLDEIDIRILSVLQKNGRITNLELSGLVGLSPAPTLERVKKLEKFKFIKSYHAKLDEKKLGFGIKAIINISLVRQKENAIQSFEKQIQKIDEIIECHKVTGNFDYHLKAIVKDITDFDALVSGKLGKIEEIGELQSNIIMAEVKNAAGIVLK